MGRLGRGGGGGDTFKCVCLRVFQGLGRYEHGWLQGFLLKVFHHQSGKCFNLVFRVLLIV